MICVGKLGFIGKIVCLGRVAFEKAPQTYFFKEKVGKNLFIA